MRLRQGHRGGCAGGVALKPVVRRTHGGSGIKLSVAAVATEEAAAMIFPGCLATCVGHGQGAASVQLGAQRICADRRDARRGLLRRSVIDGDDDGGGQQYACRSEEHTSELQSLMRIPY